MMIFSSVVITAGRFKRARVGPEYRRTCVVFGASADELRAIESEVQFGFIFLTPEAWERSDKENLIAEPIENSDAIKVGFLNFLFFWIDNGFKPTLTKW